VTSPQDHLRNRVKIPVFQASVLKRDADESGTFDGKKLSR